MEKNLRPSHTAARIVSEAPVSDGSTADEILGFTLVDGQVLEAQWRVMELVPTQQWATSVRSILGDTVHMVYAKRNGVTPELILLTEQGVYRYAPWTRDSSGGLTELYRYTSTNAHSVTPPTTRRAPPVSLVVANRVYFGWGDQQRLWVVDLDRMSVRPFGYLRGPGAPQVRGPAPDGTSPNAGGFSASGRIGTTDGSWVDSTLATVGGIDDGAWQYAQVFENVDGAYSPTSPLSAGASIRRETADMTASPPTLMQDLSKRFSVTLDQGPEDTVARIVLRTPNILRVPPGSDGSLQFLARIPNNRSTIWTDDHPDGELGEVWRHRAAAPNARALAYYDGSLFAACGSRIYWSEQSGIAGPLPESFEQDAWLECHPQSGDITALFCARPSGAWAQPSPLLIFKAKAVCALVGDYPAYQSVILHENAGCAGPHLIQAAPDGDTLFYGSGTFWRMGEGGKIEDIGGEIRKRLGRVNTSRVAFGCSWVARADKEVVFVLPVDGEETPSLQFIWDYEQKGWRFRQDVAFRAVLPLPDHDVTLVAGDYLSAATVWVYGRGHPLLTPIAPAWTYRSGWVTPNGGPVGLHVPHAARRLIVTCEERGEWAEGTPTASAYANWNRDEAMTEPQELSASNPDSFGGDLTKPMSVWGPSAHATTWGASYWRTRRPYTQMIPLETDSATVTMVQMDGDGDFALFTTTLFAVSTLPAGARTPDVVTGA